MSKTAVQQSQERSGQSTGEDAAFPFALHVKRWFDFVASAAGLLFLTPLLCLISILVRVSSPGPVIYRRRVVGLHGVEFDAFKFRTMMHDSDGRLLTDDDLARRYRENMKLRFDPRVTSVGRILRRLSLDELPQLLNVLRGEMSLVGPRMIAPEEAARYGRVLGRRLSVRPGITGLWQISGRQDTDYNTRVALDLKYVETWSLWLDLRILLKTIPTVLSMRGAY